MTDVQLAEAVVNSAGLSITLGDFIELPPNVRRWEGGGDPKRDPFIDGIVVGFHKMQSKAWVLVQSNTVIWGVKIDDINRKNWRIGSDQSD